MTENSPDHPNTPPADTAYPDTLRVTSRPFEEYSADTLDRIERWEDGENTPHVVNFQDASRLQRILTPRRLDLVQSLLDESAESIRALADRLDRDVRQVHEDAHLLADYRIVHLREEGGAKRPFVPYETVRIEVELTTSADDSSESPASA